MKLAQLMAKGVHVISLCFTCLGVKSQQVFLHLSFPSAGLSAAHFCADWLLNWSLEAKWARLLITTYPTH